MKIEKVHSGQFFWDIIKKCGRLTRASDGMNHLVSDGMNHQEPLACPSSTTGPENNRLPQRQLVLLLHADACQKLESRCDGGIWQCTLPHCQRMKDVLNHIVTCQSEKSCPVTHCVSSRQIISHWKNCEHGDCPVCLPLKQAIKNQNPNTPGVFSPSEFPQPTPLVESLQALPTTDPMSAATHAAADLHQLCIETQHLDLNDSEQPGISIEQRLASLQLSDGLQPDQVTAISVEKTKEWHQSFTPSLRNRIVEKLVQSIFPSLEPQAMLDNRIHNIVAFAKRVEMDVYEMANSRSEYYHLAERIYGYKIQKQPDKK